MGWQLDIDLKGASERIIREQFESLPSNIRMQTQERVRDLLASERRRGQVQPSALMRLAHLYACDEMTRHVQKRR